MRDFDIIFIGGGPGGYVGAIKAAQSGKKAAVVEKENLGGTCLNAGCIPTKVLLRSIESLKSIKESDTFGVTGMDFSTVGLDLTKVQERKKRIIKELVNGVNGLLRANGVTVVKGEGILKDHHTVQVSGKEYTAENIVISTGSKSKELPIPINGGMEVLTSTELLDIAKKPESTAIIGGGVIGIEFAYFLSGIGTKVTVIEAMDRILPMVDEEVTDQAVKMLEGMSVSIHTRAKVKSIEGNTIFVERGGELEQIKAEQVLMAVGRTPSLTGIPAEALGIKTEKGAIAVDETLRTSVENIYAIGDVNGNSMLAHTAFMEAIVAVQNICGRRTVMEYDKIPSAIYIQPEIACVGLTEVQAREKYGEVRIGKFPLKANAKAKITGEEDGFVKVIVNPATGEILGVHMYGIHATDMISEAVIAMKLEGTVEEAAAAVHPHPTASEVFWEAFHGASGKAIHFM